MNESYDNAASVLNSHDLELYRKYKVQNDETQVLTCETIDMLERMNIHPRQTPGQRNLQPPPHAQPAQPSSSTPFPAQPPSQTSQGPFSSTFATKPPSLFPTPTSAVPMFTSPTTDPVQMDAPDAENPFLYSFDPPTYAQGPSSVQPGLSQSMEEDVSEVCFLMNKNANLNENDEAFASYIS